MSKNKICGIYSITNKINGKIYIGQSINIKSRWSNHKYYLKKGIHQNKHLQRAYNKYGINSFSFEILEEVGMDKIDDKEKSYIRKFNSDNYCFGYNQNSGGGNNFTISDDKREKHILSMEDISRPILQISKEGIIVKEWRGICHIRKESNYNDRNVIYCCNNIRKTCDGYIWVYKENYINFNLDYFITKETNSKEVLVIEDGNVYKSAKELELVSESIYGVKFNRKNISQVCNGDKKSHKGYHFKFGCGTAATQTICIIVDGEVELIKDVNLQIN